MEVECFWASLFDKKLVDCKKIGYSPLLMPCNYSTFQNRFNSLHMKFLFTTLILAFYCVSLSAQSETPSIQKILQQNAGKYNLQPTDITDWVQTDSTVSQKSGVTHLYLRQRYRSIEIFNATASIHLMKDGKLLTMNSDFLPALHTRNANTKPQLSPLEAVQAAATGLGYDGLKAAAVTEKKGSDGKEFIVGKGNLSQEDIPVKLMYQPMADGSLRLAWDLSILEANGQNWWSVRVDAETGKILSQNNWTRHCSWDVNHLLHHHQPTNFVEKRAAETAETTTAGASYRVFPLGIESPNHGNRVLVNDPADLTASPFGWHDTNGVSGAEYTITRGNNVWAIDDVNSNNQQDGYSPDGGAMLNFDFPLTDTLPVQFQDAVITNLFYWNNIVHDVMYHYGFDEASGNFQENNYGKGGAAADYVIADAQDGSDLNNASFSSPPDGTRPRMQMYIWPVGNFTVQTPASIAKNYYFASAQFGPQTYNVTGTIVQVIDDTEPTGDGCSAFTNSAAINGNIALINAGGGCQFGTKALRAQNAGAIAVVICSNNANLISMGAGADGGSVTIPSVMISKANCDTIRAHLAETVTLNLEYYLLDSDLDNGVITHEYGHGISTRLTGGPANSNGLGGDEEMGEGWSDFYALLLTMQANHTGTDRRGIGSYLYAEPTDGAGIRKYPYSTDMLINPQTYDSIRVVPIPHGVGSVWASMLWEMTWALIDEYGFDSDLYNGTGGNNMALHLVTEALKLQPLNPGFVDGRNAILIADQVLYDGANQCLIWAAFAKRGLGFSASQGSPLSRNDGTQAFDLPPTCRVQLTKTSDVMETEAGTQITYTINAKNLTTSTISNIEICDPLFSFTSYVNGSASNGGSYSSGSVCFPPFNLAAGANTTRTFKVLVDAAMPTNNTLVVWENVEGADYSFVHQSTAPANGAWTISTANPHSGTTSFFAVDVNRPVEQYLILGFEVELSDSSELSFWHSYNTEKDWDGGRVQLSTDQGMTWVDLGNFMTQNGYNGIIDNNSATPGFSGNSDGYIQTIVDLSTFAGETVFIRFFMHCDAGVGGVGWYVDDILLNHLGSSIPNTAYAFFESVQSHSSLKKPVKILPAPLPLELQAFSGKILPRTNLLEWTTASEKAITHFIIERSQNGKNDWESIGTVIAAGYSTTLRHYKLEDFSPLPTAFYRLQAVESDGKQETSNVILLERPAVAKFDWKIYPVPTKETVQVEADFPEAATITIRIENALGQTVQTLTAKAAVGKNNFNIDVQSLAAGVYQLVLDDGRQTYVERLLKQ